MRTIILALALVLASTSLSACSGDVTLTDGGALTENSVRSVVDAMDVAWKDGNAKKGATYLSDDFVVDIAYSDGNGVRHIVSETRQKLVDSHTGGSNKQLDSGPIAIAIANGIAHAKRNVKRTVTKDGKTFVSAELEDMNLESRQGHVLITAENVSVLNMTSNGRSVI